MSPDHLVLNTPVSTHVASLARPSTDGSKVQQVEPIALPVPIHLHTLTRIAAYFQKHSVKRLRGSKLISLSHTRSILAMCYPIHFQPQSIHAWHQDLNFSHALCLLLAANLLESSGSLIIPSPHLNRWLSASQIDRQNRLCTTVKDGSYRAVLEQLTPASFPVEPERPRQLIFPELPRQPISPKNDSHSSFHIPSQGLDDWHWFDLYQVAQFTSQDQHFHLTRDSVAHAIRAGFSQNHIQWIMQSGKRQPLTSCEQNQLNRWVQDSQKYRFQQAAVLTVQRPKDLDPIFKHKKLRRAVIQQVSPCHVLVRHDAVPALRKALGQAMAVNRNAPRHLETETAWSWLAVRLMAELRRFVPAAPAPAGALIDDLAMQLSPQAHADLEATAQEILANLERVIQGKDQFFPAEKPVPSIWIETIEKAIETEHSVQLIYRSLGDAAPRTRTVWPHRLWQKSDLFYFSGWCELTGTGLTFRLDRAEGVERMKEKG